MIPDPSRKEPGDEYLVDLSPRDRLWDIRKQQADQVSTLYRTTTYDCYAGRIYFCSGYLSFCWAVDPKTGERRLKLKACRFCRVRHCPICQWRRCVMWVARFLLVFPAIMRDYPKARYLFLTLTVKNCPLGELRDTLTHMNASWKRFIHRKDFPGIGFARSTEITKGMDGTAHPHFHVLLMVKPSYFKGRNYLSQQDWTELWKSCMQIDYTPIVDIRTVKPNVRKGIPSLHAAVLEAFKYSVKPSDLFGSGSEEDQRWLVQLTTQLQKTRSIALGGVFKDYLSESEPENLLTEVGDDQLTEESERLLFGWREVLKHYVRISEA